jgi:plasmid stabilization system protein ParE
MVKSKVVWSDTALNQRRQIFEYWNLRNGNTKYSERIRVSINNRIKLITKSPEAFLNVDFANTHVTVIEKFKLFYRIYSEIIMITAFWDTRQDPEKLSKILK